MALLDRLLGRGPSAGPASAGGPNAPSPWAPALFAAELSPKVVREDGAVLVWAVDDPGSRATIGDQFTAGAEEYHRRYAASDHFERLFRRALEATGVEVAPDPLVLDLGSGSGVNSIVPAMRVFPGARLVATDLSAELLALLGAYVRDAGAAGAVACVQMDAMGELVAPGAFDLVTGASILHHLREPERGLRAAARALRPGGHAIFFEPFQGFAIMRLAYERIFAEAELRRDPLDPCVETILRGSLADITNRTDPDTQAPEFQAYDDKWLFSRERVTAEAKAAGFSEVRFAPHASHPNLYRMMAAVTLRLGSGRDDLALPDWATAILDSFDAAMTADAKREFMMEGSIVLTKAA